MWHNHSRYPGSVNSAVLSLSPYVNYQFRVIAVNDVGSSLPSVPSERYQTNGAREYRPPGPSCRGDLTLFLASGHHSPCRLSSCV